MLLLLYQTARLDKQTEDMGPDQNANVGINSNKSVAIASELEEEEETENHAMFSSEQATSQGMHISIKLNNSYCIVLVATAALWQCFYLGIVGVIFTADTLLSAVITAVCIPITEVLGVVFYHEKFTSEKGISLALGLWGLASYSYGEYLHNKDMEKERVVLEENLIET